MFCRFDVSKCFSVLAPLVIATSVVFIAENSFADIDRDSCPNLAAEFHVSGRKEPATIALGMRDGKFVLAMGPNHFVADGLTHAAGGDLLSYSVTCVNQKVRLTTTSANGEKATLVIGEWGGDGSYSIQRFVEGGDRHPPRQILYDTEKFKHSRLHVQGQCPVFDGPYVVKDGEAEGSHRRLLTTKIQGGTQFEMDQIAFKIDGGRHGSENRYYVGSCYDGEIEIKMFDGGKVERMFRLSQASIGKDVLFTEYIAARNHATLTYRLAKPE